MQGKMNSARENNIVPAQRGRVKMVAVVRDSQGRPKFDDPLNVPQEILDTLGESDLEYLGTLKDIARRDIPKG